MTPKLTLVKKNKLKGEDGFSTFSIRIPDDLEIRLSSVANRVHQSRNAVIIQILEFGCNNLEIIEEIEGEKS